jgi:hypothetical protein
VADKILDKLTPEQEARLPAIRDEWLAIGTNTNRGDRKKAEQAVVRAYEVAGLTPPTAFYWEDSPMAGCRRAAMLAEETDNPTPEQRQQQVYRARYGLFDASWLSFYSALSEFGVECCERLRPLMDLAEHCGWWWAFEPAAVLTEKPIKLNRDEQGRLHSLTEASLLFPDGWGLWCSHGVRVPKHVIESPETITVAEIDGERNVEVRRVMLEQMGFSRFIEKANAKELHRDEFGILYRRELADDVPLVCVKVVNKTAEPDGTFREYVLRVDPDCRPMLGNDNFGDPQKLTARNAIASTFGLRGEEYKIGQES